MPKVTDLTHSKRHSRGTAAQVALCLAASLFLILSNFTAGFSQQVADPTFAPIVAHPAYTKNFPRVLFDEAHNNLHTVAGRYKPFTDLISNDGYHVVAGRKSLTKESLDTFKVLITADALGAEDVDDEGAARSAFSEEECAAVRDWVKAGGALLLLSDPLPFAGANANLAKQFGVELNGALAKDAVNSESDKPDFIVYSREKHTLADNPITPITGRDDGEKINRVIVFGGQSLKGPEGSILFLKLADSAVDSAEEVAGATGPAHQVSAAGRAQGIAFKFGKGRVVVMGDADMLSALLGGAAGKEPIGMNYPGVDNRQLALNIVHWLSGR